MTTPGYLRRQADFALKALRSHDASRALAAAQRFKLVPELSRYSVEEIRRRALSVKRKHALHLVAIEHQLTSWNEVISPALHSSERSGEVARERRVSPRASVLAPPTPEQLASRVAERVRYFAEPLEGRCGGGHRLDIERVRDETLAAIRDALRGEGANDPERTEESQ